MAQQANQNAQANWLNTVLQAATGIAGNLTAAKPTAAPVAPKPDYGKIAMIGGAVLAVIVVIVLVMRK